MTRLFLFVFCAVCTLAFVAPSAEAIPPFQKEFLNKYVEGNDNAAFVEAVKTAKCNVCHVGKDKKKRNAYGMELDKLLDKKADAKDVEKIKASLDMVAGMKAGESAPTFGDLIKEGKLPGGDPSAAETGE